MNAAIRAVVRRGLSKGLKMKGILKGYDGLLNEEIIDMTAKDVSDIIGRGCKRNYSVFQNHGTDADTDSLLRYDYIHHQWFPGF